MRNRSLIIASALVVLLLCAVSLIAGAHLPPGAQLPIHWNAAGRVDGFAKATAALLMPIGLTLFLSVLMAVLPYIEPLQDRLEQSMPLYRTAWAGLLVLMILIEAMIAAPAFGIAFDGGMITIGVGILLIAIGNVLPKSRPAYFVGIRTPWTLTDPDNWVATHRLGSWTMMAGGLAIVLAALLPLTDAWRIRAIIGAMAFTIVPPFIYSYLFWKRRSRS